jgi:chromate transporter
MEKEEHVYRTLFLSTLYLSAFTFGGGYVIVSLLQKKFVDQLHWIDQEEMLDLVAIAQSSPGAIAINGSIVIGYKLGGWKGVAAAVAGAVIPPFLIMAVISFFYQAFISNYYIKTLLAGMAAGMSAVIISAVYDMASGIVRGHDTVQIVVMMLAFIANFCFGISVLWCILAAGAVGFLQSRRESV